MASDEIGWREFQIELFSRVPLRVVCKSAKKNPTTGRLEVERLAFVNVGDDALLPVFTDNQQADGFLIAQGMSDGVIMTFDKTGEFKKFLAGFDAGVYDGIIFDPGTEVGARATYYPMDQAIGILEYLESHG